MPLLSFLICFQYKCSACSRDGTEFFLQKFLAARPGRAGAQNRLRIWRREGARSRRIERFSSCDSPAKASLAAKPFWADSIVALHPESELLPE
jgi:hypothetical protein